jgi:hypothetical protein
MKKVILLAFVVLVGLASVGCQQLAKDLGIKNSSFNIDAGPIPIFRSK